MCEQYGLPVPNTIGIAPEEDEIDNDWVHFGIDTDKDLEQHVRLVFSQYIMALYPELPEDMKTKVKELLLNGINSSIPYVPEKKKPNLCDACMVPAWRDFIGGWR